MNGLNPMYDTVTRLHEEDLRRADEFRLARAARRRAGTAGLFRRLRSRFSLGSATADEAACEPARPTVA